MPFTSEQVKAYYVAHPDKYAEQQERKRERYATDAAYRDRIRRSSSARYYAMKRLEQTPTVSITA